MNTVTMEIIAKENGKLLVVNCNFMGNFGASEHESSMKIYNDLKKKYSKKQNNKLLAVSWSYIDGNSLMNLFPFFKK